MLKKISVKNILFSAKKFGQNKTILNWKWSLKKMEPNKKKTAPALEDWKRCMLCQHRALTNLQGVPMNVLLPGRLTFNFVCKARDTE